MQPDNDVENGVLAARRWLKLESSELFYRDSDDYVDGQVDIRALVVVILDSVKA